MRTLVLGLLALLISGSIQAADVVAVLSADSAPYQEALAGLKAGGASVSMVILPAAVDTAGAKVVVTFGSQAALKSYPSSLAMVAALLPDPKIKPSHSGSVTRVGLLPSAAVLAAKIKALQPGLQTLAVLDPSGYNDYIADFKAAAGALGVNVTVKKVASLADLAGVLPGLKGSVQALWLPPDATFMNPKTFMLLSQFCRSAGIAMVAPVAGLAKAGALAGVAPSFKQQGQAAGEAAQAYLAGAAPGALVYSDKVETIVNGTVAAELKLGKGTLAKADSVVE